LTNGRIFSRFANCTSEQAIADAINHPPTTGTSAWPTTGITTNPVVSFTLPPHCDNCNDPSTTNCTFRTQSDGDWGDVCPPGFKRTVRGAGCVRDRDFVSCFGELTVGCTAPYFSLTLTSVASITQFMPPPSGPITSFTLNRDYVDPLTTNTADWAGQVVALALNIGFDLCISNFSSTCFPLGGLYACDNRSHDICDSEESGGLSTGLSKKEPKEKTKSLDRWSIPICKECFYYYGKTILQIFNIAQGVLGGCQSTGSTDPMMLYECVVTINEAFIDGQPLTNGRIFSRSPSCVPEVGSLSKRNLVEPLATQKVSIQRSSAIAFSVYLPGLIALLIATFIL